MLRILQIRLAVRFGAQDLVLTIWDLATSGVKDFGLT